MRLIALAVVLQACCCSASVAEAIKITDGRLGKKITYYSGYVRLNDAVAGISKLSNVRIYAGRATDDWQVRDMPVIICANDIEVGKLLKMMTDTFFLSRSATEVDGVMVYRLYRPQALGKQLSDYAKSMESYASQLTSADWNCLLWAGSLDAAGVDKLDAQMAKEYPRFGDYYKSADGNERRLALDEIALYGKLVNCLGQDGCARISNGETVVLNAQDGGAIGDLVKEYARLRYRIYSAMASRLSNGASGNPEAPSESDIDRAALSFFLNPSGNPRNPLLSTMSIGSSPAGGTGFTGDLSGFTAFAHKDQMPRVPGVPASQNRDLKEIAKNKDISAEAKYEFGSAPEGKIQLADVLTAFSRSTGCSVVSDDYLDHKNLDTNTYKQLFGRKVSMRDVRMALDRFIWYMDEQTKRIILRDWCWCDKYANVVPKATFTHLLEKTGGSGADLMDLLTVWGMTDGQRRDWIECVGALDVLATPGKNPANKALLRLISNLDKRNLSLLMTDVLPVADIGGSQVSDVTKRNPRTQDLTEDELSRLALRLVRADAKESGKYTYSCEIVGGQSPISLPLGATFPVHSREKEAELKKAAGQVKESGPPSR